MVQLRFTLPKSLAAELKAEDLNSEKKCASIMLDLSPDLPRRILIVFYKGQQAAFSAGARVKKDFPALV